MTHSRRPPLLPCLFAALAGAALGWALRPVPPSVPSVRIDRVTVTVSRPQDVAPTIRGLLPALNGMEARR